MAVSRGATSSLVQGLPKYRSMLGGNSAYDPAATFLIQRINPTSGTSVTFSSIPQTYSILQVRFSLIVAGGDNILFRLNGDSGLNYSVHGININSASNAIINYGQASSQYGFVLGYGGTSGTTPSYPNVGMFNIIDYSKTTKAKTAISLVGMNKNPGGNIEYDSTAWLSTSAVNSITVYPGTMSSGSTIALYGMV